MLGAQGCLCRLGVGSARGRKEVWVVLVQGGFTGYGIHADGKLPLFILPPVVRQGWGSFSPVLMDGVLQGVQVSFIL